MSSSRWALCVLMAAFAASIPAPARAGGHLGDLTGPWVLFVDDYGIAEKAGVVRTYHAFEKDARNPVLSGDKPWEGGLAYVYGTVLPGEDGAGYRMWYHSWAEGEYRMLYATSEDGVHWEKPALGLVEYGGSSANNILFRRTHENHNPQVIHTPWDPDPARRYKMVYFEYGRTPPHFTVTGYYGAASPDGIHWTDVKDTPVLRDDPGDVGNFVWDAHAGRYLGYPKKFTEVRGYRRRCVGYSATTDFESWPPSKLILTPDEFDDQLVQRGGEPMHEGAHTDFYGLCGFAYESMYIGFLWMFPITDGGSDGPIFVELVSSHDGVHWTRQEEPRPPILPVGPDGAWDDGMVFTPNHPLVEGGAIRLYYGGFDVTHGVDGGRAGVGLATLRKDGFASLDAGAEEGVVTTKPLAGCSGPLRVNFRAEDGSVRVEVLDAGGAVVPGYGRGDCAPLVGDSIDTAVSWGERRTLPEVDGALRLRFVLQNASLYSFAAGASAPGLAGE
ncbi:MAG: hypothetical protein JXR94_02805 [Candidatus Hydrogenedentes bacterium]|nr:hypothetical protein [Candidatus Hydrogenedentota bacterium]